jgi:polyphosphate kinase
MPIFILKEISLHLKSHLINRDISWLSFNERVLLEASRSEVPVLERLKFLSIYSSNLDEFYRVRIPALIALHQINNTTHLDNRLTEVNEVIARQQKMYGKILREDLLPLLHQNNIHFVYSQPIPDILRQRTRDFFLTHIAAFLQPVPLFTDESFFPENNKIYLAVQTEQDDKADVVIVNIPSVECGRFYSETIADIRYVVTVDDIIRDNIKFLFPDAIIKGIFSFKITRDAELDLEDEFKGDIAEKIEQQILLRDLGLATRLLYDADMPGTMLEQIIASFQLGNATLVEGGRYHNLRDLADFPVKQEVLSYTKWPALTYRKVNEDIFESVKQKDILLHVPYQSYDTLLQFFNQAAIDPYVTDISITLYRIAGDSLIGNALISAAKNGKNVTVFVELKARFDEANNIRWSKKMKAAGVKIIYSIPGLKVHAKVALIKRIEEGRGNYYGIFATGNFNENTARFYTDHILITAHKDMLRELELLFIFLSKRRKPETADNFPLQHLLIAQFNLQSEFLLLIGREIEHAQKGLPAAIIIKLNNLEEEVLIEKLYEASQAGVKVDLVIRGICRLKPGVAGLSEHITVRRIVDRYLEHGRIFIFQNGNNPEIYMGSADWMSRNIYRRIEVCFPVYDRELKKELISIMQLQLDDNISAVEVDASGTNSPLKIPQEQQVHAQYEIYQLIKKQFA